MRPYAVEAEMISNLTMSGAWISTNLEVSALAWSIASSLRRNGCRHETPAAPAYFVRNGMGSRHFGALLEASSTAPILPYWESHDSAAVKLLL